MGTSHPNKSNPDRRRVLESAHRSGAGPHGRSRKAERRRQRQHDQRALTELREHD